ncbi:MAG TPA: outer membrane protein assembly factor BamD [Rhodanobacteraceae bacterium]|nr:outer membrane protein assembly factor BamD [Rhodanobacteraceae bacterium]
MRLSHALRIVLLLITALSLGACASFGGEKNPLETLPVSAMYQKGNTAMLDGDYAQAERVFQRLVARFPFGPYSEQAQLDLVYSQFKADKPDDAYSGINRFIKTYPAHKHIDYAYYLRGLINFNRSAALGDRLLPHRDRSRRDQSFALQSFSDFSQMLQRYPDSRYAADAAKRMIYLRNQLAQHELNVAMYYLRRQAYVGAADRAQYIIEHYQTSPQTGDALAVMAKAYEKLGRDKLAGDAIKVLKANYPDHPFLHDDDWPDFPGTWRRAIPFASHD